MNQPAALLCWWSWFAKEGGGGGGYNSLVGYDCTDFVVASAYWSEFLGGGVTILL